MADPYQDRQASPGKPPPAAGATREPFTFYLAVGVIYLIFTTFSELAFSWAQKRLAIGVRQGSL